MRDKIYLIDASGFLYRAYFAIQGLSNRQGESTGALFGFIRSFLRLKDEFQPNYLAAIFDAERGKESRVALYSEYKAHRKPTPPDLIQQILQAQEFCRLAGVPMLAVPGVEADDTIASVTTWAKDQGMDVLICTSDKDMAQLVDDKVKLLNLHKDMLIVDAEKAKEIYGVPPEQMRDYLAIVGDASDNVPGISGLGSKSAIQLLSQYGTLENILSHADEIGGKKGQTLKDQKEQALLSQKLVTVSREVEFEKDLSHFQLKSPDEKNLWDFLRAKNFNSLLNMAPEHAQSQPRANYHTITTLEALNELLKKLEKAQEVCLDTETTSEKPMRADLVGIGLGVNDKDAYYIPFNGPMAKSELIAIFKPFFENHDISFYGHNIKYDLHVLERAGIKVGKVSGDTIISSYLLNAHQRRHSLDDLTLAYFGKKKIETTELLGKGKNQITMDQVPIEKVSEYCCEDVECTVKLKTTLDSEIETRGLKKLLEEIELPIIRVLTKMERKGIFVDTNVLKVLSVDISKQIEALQEEIYQMAGEPFNLNSPKQLSEILYQKLGIHPPRKGRTMPSTSADVLESLAPMYPIAQRLLTYRTLEKLRSTYIETLPEEINPETGRIHCTFNQSVAATGRLSCQNPNLQNIPVRSELGLKIRSAFRPEKEGWSFLAADYSQIELRILAHVSGDEGLLDAFHRNADIHAYTASEIFHIPLAEVSDERRTAAKAVTFGVIYGQQAFGLSQTLGIPMSSAQSFIDAFFKRYIRVKEYIENAKAFARKEGKAISLTGRERLIPDVNNSNMTLRSQAERLAVNTPFQATNADIIKMAMIQIDEWLEAKKLKSAMLLQIHDELVFEAPDDELSELEAGVKKIMEGVFQLKVPLLVKIGIGKNWMEC